MLENETITALDDWPHTAFRNGRTVCQSHPPANPANSRRKFGKSNLSASASSNTSPNKFASL